MTAIMESSNHKNEIFDPIRKKWVEKTPEEQIRQRLIHQMIEKLGYPKSLLAVEKELSKLAKVPASEVPKRRADIVVFSKNESGELVPLLMIECKSVPLTPQFAQQVIGYNAFIGAPFIALANDTQILTGFYSQEAGIYRFEKGLPSYLGLTAAHF